MIAPSTSLRLKRLLRALGFWLLLALVFAAYLQPSFILDLATRFVLC
jgi:hypothetical protein